MAENGLEGGFDDEETIRKISKRVDLPTDKVKIFLFNYRNNVSVGDAAKKLNYEEWYIRGIYSAIFLVEDEKNKKGKLSDRSQ